MSFCVIDPRDIRFRGAEIEIHSTGAQELGGLTWAQVNATVSGLQQSLYLPGIFREAHFKILDGLTKVSEQGEGWLTAARKVPRQADVDVA